METAQDSEEIASNIIVSSEKVNHCSDLPAIEQYQGAKPKVFSRKEDTSHATSAKDEEAEMRRWKAAGIALKKALNEERRKSQFTQDTSADTAGSAYMQGTSAQQDEASCYSTESYTIYKRNMAAGHKDYPFNHSTDNTIPTSDHNCFNTHAHGDSNLQTHHKQGLSDSPVCSYWKSTCLRGHSRPSAGISTLHDHQHPSLNPKRKHCHKSRLPVPIRKASHKRTRKDKNNIKGLNSIESKTETHRRKSKSFNESNLESRTVAVSDSVSSSENEYGPLNKPSTKETPKETAAATAQISILAIPSYMLPTDSVTNLADEEFSSEQTHGDTSDEERKLLLEASLARTDNRPANPICFLSSSEGSASSVMSCSDEALNAAERVLSSYSPPQYEHSREAQADDYEDDSLDLDSDEEFELEDIPGIESDESQAHAEEENEQDGIRLTPIDLKNIEHLQYLNFESSDEDDETSEKKKKEASYEDRWEGANDDADDEFEGLPDLMPEIGGWNGMALSDDQEDNYFAGLGMDYQFQALSLSATPLGMMLQQGRTPSLQFMFQNVILQMLAVNPDLLGEQAPPPLAPQRLCALPTIHISARQKEATPDCPICLCAFEEAEEAKELPCHHVFHALCIQAWLSKSGTCPVCRYKL